MHLRTGAFFFRPRPSTRDVIPRALRNRGALVDVVEAYRNVVPEEAAARAKLILSAHPLPDWVTFTSSSAADNLVAAVGTGPFQRCASPLSARVTSATIRRYGLHVNAEPQEHTISELVKAMEM